MVPDQRAMARACWTHAVVWFEHPTDRQTLRRGACKRFTSSLADKGAYPSLAHVRKAMLTTILLQIQLLPWKESVLLVTAPLQPLLRLRLQYLIPVL